MPNRTENLRPNPTPEAAVADAMMHSQAQFVLKYVTNIDPPTASVEIDRALEIASSQKCFHGALGSLEFLHEKYSHLFSYLIYLRREESYDHQGEYNFLQHAFFLALGKDKVWFAGSPANHDIEEGRNSPMVTVLQANSLEDILSQIKTVDPGRWPQSTTIHQILSQHYQDLLKQHKMRLHCLTFLKSKPKTERYWLTDMLSKQKR